MNKLCKVVLFLLVLQLSLSVQSELYGDTRIPLISPVVKGFYLKSKPVFYTPDNLYDYINGAADIYLNYNFKKLSVFEYRNKKKSSITVDIYEHRDINNGFGIYSSEKPLKGDFLKIGTNGYYEKGVLNFFKGNFYVKMSCFGIKKNEKKILTELAKGFSKQFQTKTGFPKVLFGFPEKNRIKNSERYISKNFLGHSFLHSAFVSDYLENKRTFQVFIIETEKESDTKKILEDYMSFLKNKNVIVEKEVGILSFIDPYYKNKGKMFLKFRNNHVWGLFSKDSKKAALIINLIDSRLKKTYFK